MKKKQVIPKEVFIDSNGFQIDVEEENMPVLVRHNMPTEHILTDNIMHWHHMFEFTVCLSGEYHIEFANQEHVLKPGDGVFINSDMLHNCEATGCEFALIMASPSLLCPNEYVWKNFVLPLMNLKEFPGIILHQEDPNQKEVIDKLLKVCKCWEDRSPSFPLVIQSTLIEVWQYFYENVSIKSKYHFDGDRITSLKGMMDFIQKHYSEKITLKDIAKSQNISEATCNRLFHRYLNQSPTAYLIDYRLTKAKELLTYSTYNMTEIAERCGFNGSSYFSEMFKKQYGMSPRDYRKNPEVKN